MKPRDWPAAWAYLPELVRLCQPADIGTLNARKFNGLSRPTGITFISIFFGVPSEPGIDIRIVDSCGGDLHEDILDARNRYGNILADVQLIHIAVAG